MFLFSQISQFRNEFKIIYYNKYIDYSISKR